MKIQFKRLLALGFVLVTAFSLLMPLSAVAETAVPAATETAAPSGTEEPSDAGSLIDAIEEFRTAINGFFETLENIKQALELIKDGKYLESFIARIGTWVCEGFYYVIDLFFDILDGTDELLETDIFQSTLMLAAYTGNVLFWIGVVLAIADIAIQYKEGAVHQSLLNTGKNLVLGYTALQLFYRVPLWLYTSICSLNSSFTRVFNTNLLDDLYALTEGLEDRNILYDAIGALIAQNPTFLLMVIILIIVLIVNLVKTMASILKKGGVLVVMCCIGSLYMFSIPRGFTDAFWSWCKQVLGLCLTTFVQVLLVYAGLAVIISQGILILDPIPNIILVLFATGAICVAPEVPKYMDRFGIDTSVKSNVMYAASSAAHTVTSVKSLVSTFVK